MSERVYAARNLGVVLLFWAVMLTLIKLPFAFEDRNRLREAYDGSRSVQMVTFRSHRGRTCGLYQLGRSGLQWKYVQESEGFWAGEKSPDWRRLGDESQPGRDWLACMRGQSDLFDWVAMAIAQTG
jgi:hypothetical protein